MKPFCRAMNFSMSAVLVFAAVASLLARVATSADISRSALISMKATLRRSVA
ncbi:hypothetical protein D9M71_400420 [compost metagenome]